MKKNEKNHFTIAALITAWSALAAQSLPDKNWEPIVGPVAYGATDVISIHIAGTGYNEYDRLHITGTLTPGRATLNVFPCYQPIPGDSFVIFKAPTIVGKFSSPPLIDAGGNFFVLSYEKENGDDIVVLTVVTKLFGLYINTSDSPLVVPDYNYTLTVVAEPKAGGNVNVNPTQATYKVCDEITIEATANEGYAFTHWTQEGGAVIANTASPTTTATMPARDVTITAKFCELPDAMATDATDITTNTFTANWKAVPGDAVTYTLDVAMDEDFEHFVDGYEGLDVGDATSHPVVGLVSDTTYHYHVTATDACGTSEYSNTVIVTTAASMAFPCPASITFTYRGDEVTYGVLERGGLCWMDRN